MGCDAVRAALSAAVDGEDPGIPAELLEHHLHGCPRCRLLEARQTEGDDRQHPGATPVGSVVNVMQGSATLLTEFQHLFDLVGLSLVWALARSDWGRDFRNTGIVMP